MVRKGPLTDAHIVLRLTPEAAADLHGGIEAVIPLEGGGVPVNIDPEKIANAIARKLAPLFAQGGEINIHLHIDGNEIGRAVARQASGRNPDLVEAIQQIARSV